MPTEPAAPRPSTASGAESRDRAAPAGFAGVRPGQERSDNGLELALCWCPAGTFTMGSPPDEPDRGTNEDQVRVTLTRGFWLGKYEVTQEQYRHLIGTNPSHFASTGDGKETVAGLDTSRFPVEQVTWEMAVAFCRKLTEQERAAGRLPAGWEYRLPTEAQWEYACRAGTTTATAFGDRLSSRQANFTGEYGVRNLGHPAEVGQYPPNGWEIHDLHANVWEWCSDWYERHLQGGADPMGPSEAALPARVLRGGCWVSLAKDCRSADRRMLAGGSERIPGVPRGRSSSRVASKSRWSGAQAGPPAHGAAGGTCPSEAERDRREEEIRPIGELLKA